jgi:hypothetical protein
MSMLVFHFFLIERPLIYRLFTANENEMARHFMRLWRVKFETEKVRLPKQNEILRR